MVRICSVVHERQYVAANVSVPGRKRVYRVCVFDMLVAGEDLRRTETIPARDSVSSVVGYRSSQRITHGVTQARQGRDLSGAER